MIDLYEMKQEELHHFWPFLQRGVNDIHHDLKPNWLPEDIFAVLRNQQVSCVIARRGKRLLAFAIYSRQLRYFSFLPEIFIWVGWTIPMREWQPEDDMPTVAPTVVGYIVDQARKQGIDQVTWITRPNRAKAFARKFGWKPAWTTIAIEGIQ